jgi:hypothetical protein
MFKRTDENKNNYMQELDEWVEVFVFNPLHAAWAEPGLSPDYSAAAPQTVRQSIKDKVLESYRNGQSHPPKSASRRPYGGYRK